MIVMVQGPHGCEYSPWKSSEGSYVRLNEWFFPSLDIFLRLCTDSELMRSFWDRYDALDGGSKVFTSLISSLKRLATEKPALLGVGHQMLGVGVGDGGHGLEAMAGMVASAATQTVTGALGYGAPEAGLSLAGSSMKLQW